MPGSAGVRFGYGSGVHQGPEEGGSTLKAACRGSRAEAVASQAGDMKRNSEIAMQQLRFAVKKK